MTTNIYTYQLVFKDSNDPTVEEINEQAKDGWQCIQVGHREGAPNQFVYLMQKLVGVKEIEPEVPPGPVQEAQDDFEREDGALGANWAAPAASEAPVVIVSGQATAAITGAICCAYWSGGAFAENQYSEVQLGDVTDSVALMVRVDGATDRFYMAVAANGAVSRIYFRDNGAWTLLTDIVTVWATGDWMKFEIEGTTHPFILRLFKNEQEVLSWQSVDNTQEKPGGSPGIGFNGLGASILNWNGCGMEATLDVLVGTFTASSQDNRINISGHGLTNGTEVRFALGTEPINVLPAPLDEETYYFVVGSRLNDFQVSLTSGGAVLDITTNGVGGTNQVWHK